MDNLSIFLGDSAMNEMLEIVLVGLIVLFSLRHVLKHFGKGKASSCSAGCSTCDLNNTKNQSKKPICGQVQIDVLLKPTTKD
jgi:hypothetical protein